MGDPKKHRKKYTTPKHPWQKARINAEKEIIVKYGLKNKKEIWKADSALRKFKYQGKKVTALRTEQAKKEEKQLLDYLKKIGLLGEKSTIDDVLALEIKDMLDRRLQSQVLKQGLARTSKQARQMVIHGHIAVAGRKVSIPSYLLTAGEESKISYVNRSSFKNEDHPERTVGKKQEEEKPKQEENEKKSETKNQVEEKVNENAIRA
ncbi:30S ribosomal protein S4 [Candidatus Woesearchaeota archaeon]|nr:30S ribosomal protein S4 [Candidatus Woesearchaeota archaeon]